MGILQRHNTMDMAHHKYAGCTTSDMTTVGISSLKKERNGSTGHRRHHSEPIYYPSILSQLLPDSEEALESHHGSSMDDDRIGGSWDDAKRFLIESRKQDLEISNDMERFRKFHKIEYGYYPMMVGADILGFDINLENMHLYLSEMLIAAMEQMQWRAMVESQQNPIVQTKNVSV
ncbi:unnamed protein product [Onchocerca flexuosa]|uniref:CACTA en-spm transposon protein n=1 Tax=Onchocerca flexuosa TaxID=387005 RepID=A0A183I6I3_9BILA|nr:unnamed protein product [Onchocerca flexuosa]